MRSAFTPDISVGSFVRWSSEEPVYVRDETAEA